MTDEEFRALLLETQLRAYNTPGAKLFDTIYEALAPLVVTEEK